VLFAGLNVQQVVFGLDGLERHWSRFGSGTTVVITTSTRIVCLHFPYAVLQRFPFCARNRLKG
jgi:hypothetical protein